MSLYKLIWDDFCSWFLEMVKPSYGDPIDSGTLEEVKALFEDNLRLLHPFMPFITEEIWQKLPVEGESIMIAAFPQFQKEREDQKAERTMDLIMSVVTAVRNIRGEMNINPGQKLDLLMKWLTFVSMWEQMFKM